jgi:hypothetical protein
MVNRTKTPVPAQRRLSPAISLLWLGLAVWGTLAMMSESSQPGPAGAAPAQWPAASKLARFPQRPSLVMFVHPACGCSKASLAELCLLMEHCKGRVTTHVLILCQSGQPTNAAQGGVWREAAAIPGACVEQDWNGSEARLFRTETSGEVILYGMDGRLRFQGGLTSSCSQAGDNPGRAALQALIDHQPSKLTQTPVFGCRLFKSNLTAK